MPEVSVIVPVYKVEKYLRRCLDSILAQTFKDFELLLIDDGSPDNSGVICDEYAKKDPRVKVFHKENGGAGSARNVGLENAHAESILFVDSDDYIDRTLLLEVTELQKAHNADIVEFALTFSKDDSIISGNQSVVVNVFSGKDMILRLYQDCVGGSVYPVNKLFRKSLFENIRFEEGRINEDTVIAPILYFNATTVVVTNKIYYYYYLTPESSVTRSAFSLKKLDCIHAFRSNRVFYEANSLDDAKDWLDATYAFVLAKMLHLTRKTYGRNCEEYLNLKKEYKSLLILFLRNSHLMLKQKILLAVFAISV